MYIKDLDDKYVAGTYNRFPLELVSGKGCVLKDVNGKEYIDLGSGIGVTAFGINDGPWTDAVKVQLDKVQHTSNLYYTEPCARLAEALCEKTGMKKVFFGNSGAEANECAIKVARKWAAENKGEEYNVIVTLVNSFHGRTLTTLAATGQEVFHKYFQPLTPGFAYVEAENVEMLKKVCEEEKVAGILFECIQGEGGVVPLTADFIQAIADICEEKNIIMMVDEVQTGNGRTGMMYSYMNFGLKPDVVSTAKGLGGGLPIGACLMSEKVQNVLGPSDHGSTFGGNPVASAGALSIVNRLDDALMAEVKEKSAYIFEEMEGAKGVESVTGLGLMIGIKTEKPVSEVLSKCMEKGVICLSAKDKVRLLPALNIPMDVLKKAVAVIKEVCAE
ncbi:MAG: acetylornithine/succinylornithine family transaminase [Lachnospiraceae bacterium]|nr:acetylornithine/succinylornithine family transaminase [Lachnospiraceae bacterium]